MAITPLGKLAGGNEKPGVADAGLVVTFTSPTQVGDVLFLAVSADNLTASTPVVAAVVDSRSATNVWGAGSSSNASTATAAAAVILHVLVCTVVVAHQAGDTLSITLGGAVVAKAGVVIGLRGSNATLTATVSNRGTSGGPSLVVNPGAVGRAVVGAVAFENNAVPTGDSDTTNGSWSTIAGEASSGGSGATNAAVGMQVKVVTASGNQTWNPTGSNDWSAIAFYVTENLAKSGSGSISQTFSVSGSGTKTSSGTGAISTPPSASGSGAKSTSGAGALPVTTGTTAAGRKEAQGGAIVAVTFTLTGSGFEGAGSGGITSVTFTVTASGAKAAVGGGSIPTSIAVSASGQGTHPQSEERRTVGGARPTIPPLVRKQGRGRIAVGCRVSGAGVAARRGEGEMSVLLDAFGDGTSQRARSGRIATLAVVVGGRGRSSARAARQQRDDELLSLSAL